MYEHLPKSDVRAREIVRECEAEKRMHDAAPDMLRALKHLVRSMDDLIAESGGVYGLHLNGDLAPWNSLTEGGHFECWLIELERARDAIAKAEGSHD